MKKKLAALGATLLLLFAVVGFSNGSPQSKNDPAQAWYYGNCTARAMDGSWYCYKWCTLSMEKYYVTGCGTWVRFNQWSA